MAHLDTFALAATRDEPDEVARASRREGFFKATGEYLGLSFAASNPRKALKRTRRPLGNLPLEILTYLAAFTDELISNGQLPVPMTQTLACKFARPTMSRISYSSNPDRYDDSS